MTEKRGFSGSTIKQSLESARIFPYSSTYALAVKQKVGNEAENRERYWAISLLILREKTPTVLQSSLNF